MSTPPTLTLDAGRAADRAARHAAQTVFDRPLVLEAGAGTGKTTTLVARALAWCLGPGWERAEAAAAGGDAGAPGAAGAERIAARVLEGVVAITFTEAAAAEMAHRLGGELGRLAAGTDPPGWLDATTLPAAGARTERAGALLATLDHLVVRTFHAWCHALLAGHPLEAGLHPQLTVDADGLRLDEVVRETVEAALPAAYGDPGDPAFLDLAEKGFGPPRLVEALLELARAGLPAEVLERDPLDPERAGAIVAALSAACRRLHDLAGRRCLGAGGSPKTAELAAELARAVDGLYAASAAGDLSSALAAVAGLCDEGLRDRLKEWGKGRFNKTEAALLDDSPGVPEAAAELRALLDHAARLDPDLLASARAVLAPLLGRVQAELRSRGVVTFNDLLAEAARLLAGRPEVRRAERRRIEQLLVDEFQDTDPLQCEIVGWLALDGPPEERPGLFLVGDPKQSIYGWRSADLAAYDAFVERALAAGGERHTLRTNFRSVPPILDEVARSVAPVMAERRGIQPPFEALLPRPELEGAPGYTAGGRAAVEWWVSWRRGEDGAPSAARVEAMELEAEAIAADLVALAAEGVPWREMAVLFRSTGDLPVYLEALRRRRVPFQVARDREYYRRREVIEAAALVRTVLDPGDHLALLTALRAPWVGVPDAALIPLWRRQFPKLATELTAPDREALSTLASAVREAALATPREAPGIDQVAGWERPLLAFLEALASAREAFEREPADTFVERLRTLTLIEATEAARYLGPYRLANLERFFARLLATLEEGGGNATALLRMLRAAVAEQPDADEARPEEGLEDAVAVSTIHTAKGLDWQHVFLAQLHKGSRSDSRTDTEATRLAGGDRGGGPDGWEYRLFGAATLGFDAVERRRAEVDTAERVRTLYVAMTRAERRLVLCGCWSEAAGGAGWEPPPPERAASHLDLLAGRPPRALAELWRQLSGDPAAAWDDPHGTRWRFPGLAAGGAGAATAQAPAAALPPAAEVERAAAELARRAEAAALRMARPFSIAASNEAHARLAVLAAEEGLDAAPERRGVAMAIGSAIHRALEELDLEAADAAAALARQRDRLPAYLATAPEAERDRALAAAGELLDRLAGGSLLARLHVLGPHVAARELPVLLPPDAGAAGPGPDTGDHAPLGSDRAEAALQPLEPEQEGRGTPVGFVAGVIDLLYRDPETGAWVIVDYKTDAVDSPTDLARRAAAYAPQGRIYARAVRDALGLESDPRFELWFLAADRIVAAGAPAASPVPEPPPAPRQLGLF